MANWTLSLEERLWGRVLKTDTGCWEFQGHRSPSGYCRIWAFGKKDGAHRASWILANGTPVPEGVHVLHSCDNRICVNPEHLSLGTHQDNMQDMVAKGRAISGVKRLTDEQVQEIRSRYVARLYKRRGGPAYSNAKELAEEYGVSSRYLRVVANGAARA